MEITDRTPVRAELLGAYRLDSPVLNGEACCCAAQAVGSEIGRRRRSMLRPVMLSAAVALVALACVVAFMSR